MSVALRLARAGSKGAPQYRIVATTKGTKRDGKFLEIIGTYNPNSATLAMTLKEEKIKKWLALGAQPTEVVRSLIKKGLPGVMEQLEEKRKLRTVAQRRARKDRAKARSKK